MGSTPNGMNFNPYSVLDVPMSADFDTLRATYRRLARQNHPDIAPDKGLATERMAQINRAWGILGDAGKRAEWDGQWRRHSAEQTRQELLRREAVAREAAARQASRAAAQRVTASPAKATPRSASRPVAGQSAAARHSNSATNSATRRGAGGLRASPLPKTAARSAGRRQNPLDARAGQVASPHALALMRKITLAARLFHRDGNARGAIEMCRAVLLSDKRNVPARELLSEIFASQGRLEIAVMMLDQAIQLAPDDVFLRRKRDHLENARFPGGALRPIQRPSWWQRLRTRFKMGR